ncbi:hypothetical protein Acr_00g0067130 [Actinidia rufa]|uniref:Uncharacterized protein n=1 Tax=Actinidia rufa TaxID=165716 RepID=A0A7J0DSF0_9ERIC|nr:hypothetical protein Acr_00g0067130 [Actinidia rufa]
MFHFTLEALREFVRAIRDERHQPPPPPHVAVEPVVHRAPTKPRAISTMREFRRQDPPHFSREPDPIKAELWLKRINIDFELNEGLRPSLRGASFELNTFEEGNNPRGRGRSTRIDSSNPPILSHNSLNSRGLPLSTSLGVHISQQSGQPQLGYKSPILSISAPPPSSQASRASIPCGQQQQASRGQPQLYAIINAVPEPSVIRGSLARLYTLGRYSL